MIKKGTWVEIESVVLEPEERSSNLPEDTKKVPMKMWVKGFCTEDCEIGEEVEIETIVGRKETGIVVEVKPSFNHDFGKYVPEIAYIGRQAKKMLRGR